MWLFFDFWDLFPYELLSFGIDICLTSYFYYRYRRNKLKAEAVQDAKEIQSVQDGLILLNKLPPGSECYVCVSGARACSLSAYPSYSSYDRSGEIHEGVLRRNVLFEHKSNRYRNVWLDQVKVVRDDLESIPFQLIWVHRDDSSKGAIDDLSNGEIIKNISNKDHIGIRVENAANADFIHDELKTIHTKYEPHETSAISQIIGLLFGSVTRGHEEREMMLLLGTKIMGIGSISLNNDSILTPLTLHKPTNSCDTHPFILTTVTQSKEQLAFKLHSDGKFWMILTTIGCGIGTIILFLIGKKIYAEYQRRKTMREMREELNRRRRNVQPSRLSERGEPVREIAGDDDDGNDDGNIRNSCTVCWENERQLLIDDCGHVCLCNDCYITLPQPKKCPICRTLIRSTHQAYI